MDVMMMMDTPSPCVERLSRREREVVRRALLGDRNKVIAYDLGLADSTVRVLMRRAAAKLQVRSRRELLEKLADLPPIIDLVTPRR
jgi:DNA-binding CsgD family transcriptional regulator